MSLQMLEKCSRCSAPATCECTLCGKPFCEHCHGIHDCEADMPDPCHRKYPRIITIAPSHDLRQKRQVEVKTFGQVVALQKQRYEILSWGKDP